MPRIRKSGAVYPIKYETRKKLKDGSVRVYSGWHAKVGDRWVSAKTYKDCDRKIASALKEKTEWGMGINHGVTLGEYADKWFEVKQRTIKPNSIDLYKSMLKVHLTKYRDARIADVTPSMVQRMLVNMRNLDGTPCSVSRKQSMYNILRQIFEAATGDRVIPTSPVIKAIRPKKEGEKLAAGNAKALPQAGKDPDMKKKDGRSGEQHREAFDFDQMRAMLETAAAGDLVDGARQWCRLLSGMRQNELLGMLLDDLKLWRDESLGPGVWRGVYKVNWQLSELNRRHGCGERDRNGYYPCGYKRPMQCPRYEWVVPDGFDVIHLYGRFALTPPKSQRGKEIPIIPQLGTVLHLYLEETKDMPNPYGLLFRVPDGRPIDALDDRSSFRDLMRRAGIPDYEHRYGHECRNSVATLLFHMGVDSGIIQRILGHASVEMSEHYRTVPLEDLMRGMDTIGRELGLKQIEWKTQEESIPG